MKRLLLILAGCVISASAMSANVATGQITKIGAGKNNFHIYLQGTANSPCGSGYFYSYIGDTDPHTWKTLQDLALSAYNHQKQVTIYANDVKCNAGTQSRFEALSID